MSARVPPGMFGPGAFAERLYAYSVELGDEFRGRAWIGDVDRGRVLRNRQPPSLMLYGLLSIAAASGERTKRRRGGRAGFISVLQAVVVAVRAGLLRLFAPRSARKL